MYSYVTLAVFALASMVAAAPLPRADGTLGGVVDALAPITAGLGVTVNNLAGFAGSPSGTGGSVNGGSGVSSTGLLDRSDLGLLDGLVDVAAPVAVDHGVAVDNLAGFH
ncbi:hypothetical protein GGI00_002783 [Coemansia sp. RSA 2681]|nr:hypothetical protein GGI00_002783 [Coemansia sp. RSA 2681]